MTANRRDQGARASRERKPGNAAFSHPQNPPHDQEFIDQVNSGYEVVHKAFEAQFWGTKMVLSVIALMSHPYMGRIPTKLTHLRSCAHFRPLQPLSHYLCTVQSHSALKSVPLLLLSTIIQDGVKLADGTPVSKFNTDGDFNTTCDSSHSHACLLKCTSLPYSRSTHTHTHTHTHTPSFLSLSLSLSLLTVSPHSHAHTDDCA